MRRSRRFEGHIWLKYIEGMDECMGLPMEANTSDQFAAAVHALGEKFDLVLVFEQVDDVYYLRCYPRHHSPGPDYPNWAAAYASHTLNNTAAAAYRDYTAIHVAKLAGIFSRSEHVRHVGPLPAWNEGRSEYA